MSSVAKVCSVEGCDRKVKGYGYCANHLRFLRVKGDPDNLLPPEAKRKCVVNGCTKLQAAGNLCTTHFWRKRRNGDFETLKLEHHGLHDHPVYLTWKSMKKRCLNQNSRSYRHYGGKGVQVCERWRNSFKAFLEDVGERPKGMTLDRKNNDGNYSYGKCPECVANGWPMNVRWATKLTQAQNTGMNGRNTSGYKGVTFHLGKWQARIMFNYRSISLGLFATKEEASVAYKTAKRRYHKT